MASKEQLERGEQDALILAMLVSGYSYSVIARRIGVRVQELVRYVIGRGWDRPEAAWEALQHLRRLQLEALGMGNGQTAREVESIIATQRSEVAVLRGKYHELLRRLSEGIGSARERKEIFEELKIIRISAEIAEILHRIDRQLYGAEGAGDVEIIIDTQPA